MDVGVRVAISPAEVGVQRVARHIVRAYAGVHVFGEGEAAKPFPQLRHLPQVGQVRQSGTEHRFGGHRGVRADLQCGPVTAARDLVDHSAQ